MPSILQSVVLGLASTSLAHGHTHATVNADYIVDVHSHVIPPIWKEALISAGYPLQNGTLYVDDFPVPDWTLESHLSTMQARGINFSTVSVTAPGVAFLAHDSHAAHRLARTINLQMHNWTQTHPTKLGALCLLPLPHVNESLAELEFCLDTLDFPGVGLYTNFNGSIYLGDAVLDPVFAALHARRATAFVHPAAPACTAVARGYPMPLTEYPFDTVRAMENLLLTGQRARYPDVKLIFAHGGGAMPYLAPRIAGLASMEFMGGLSLADSLAQLAGYYFETASATSAVQLAAMKSFIGVDRVLTGTDYPYVPGNQIAATLPTIQKNGGFNGSEMTQIHARNALGLFPRVAEVLGFL
ncbi:amidohydrolase family protein [Aspergillus homomorphus CBS 101889]|uniref:6-methylsalicylate decarboxylase n=1 Tax=Aspergillus homomorphus (strain CBS 101889) TaxID=1450537 RepID=A0A395HNS5_ASPHC|nr:amidohydrolase 2 [Aspergillus homomorphus CBS 101889]RAL07924.1 amidohydrolase 2 [Aspergillus homomorphus CBS 101889]